jgi:hypothetical protein
MLSIIIYLFLTLANNSQRAYDVFNIGNNKQLLLDLFQGRLSISPFVKSECGVMLFGAAFANISLFLNFSNLFSKYHNLTCKFLLHI